MGIITVTVNSKEHNIDTMIMPYFASNTSPNHTIPHFDLALRCIYEGFHIAFETFKSDLTHYPSLCATLKQLDVYVLGGHALPEIIERFKRFQFNDEATRIANTTLAEDWVFRFLYMHHAGLLSYRDRSRVFNAVSYVVAHRYFYNHYTRSVIRETYKTMSPSANQLAFIEEWPVYGEDGRPLEPVIAEDDEEVEDDYDSPEAEAYFYGHY